MMRSKQGGVVVSLTQRLPTWRAPRGETCVVHQSSLLPLVAPTRHLHAVGYRSYASVVRVVWSCHLDRFNSHGPVHEPPAVPLKPLSVQQLTLMQLLFYVVSMSSLLPQAVQLLMNPSLSSATQALLSVGSSSTEMRRRGLMCHPGIWRRMCPCYIMVVSGMM